MDLSIVGSLGWIVALLIGLIWFWNSLYIIKEWERGAVLRLGRMIPEAKSAGLRIVFWPIETLYRIPLRVVTLDVPSQDIITRDNVSVKVNAVCYFKVVDANRALDHPSIRIDQRHKHTLVAERVRQLLQRIAQQLLQLCEPAIGFRRREDANQVAHSPLA